MSTRSTPWPAGTPCWVDISVPDPARSTAFYRDVLGWTYVDTGAEFGHYQIARTNGLAAAAIGPQRSPEQPVAWTLYFASDDADATAAAVTAHGGTLLAEPFDIPGSGRMCAALDPTGAAFAVWQAAGSIGCEVVNEAGALVWEDGRLADPAVARDFYAAVFGFGYTPVEGAPPDYMLFSTTPGAPLGGIGGAEGSPPQWLVYFAVADVDVAVAAVRTGGGQVRSEPADTPFGRIATVTDPDGAVFDLAGPASP